MESAQQWKQEIGENLLQSGSETHMFLEAAQKLGKENILRDLNYKADLLAVEAKKTLDQLAEHWHGMTFTDAVHSDDCAKLLRDFSFYITQRSEAHPIYAFWSSYHMVQLMLLFLQACREGNWSLNLGAVHQMLPRFFALDRVN
ncbi:hypothetical protein ACOMHN_058117 [Nucella lapillus]